MNEPRPPANTPDEDTLFAYGDDPHAAPANDLEATVRRLQRAAGVDTATPSSIPTDLKHQIWEDLMHAQTATATPRMPIALQATGRVAELVSARSRPTTPPSAPASWLNRAANVLLAAALILAISTGIWRATGGLNLGFGDDGPRQPTIPFGGIVAQDENGDLDPADLPTAEDCTVEPLTVDEVIWYIQDPYEASFSTDMASPGPLPTEVVQATPPATNGPNYEPGPASQDVLDAAADTQRMWMACILADSYFQVWALEDPFFVREQIRSVLPPLTGEDEARAILEDLRDNGPQTDGMFNAFSSRGYPGTGGIHVIDTDPANSWQDDVVLLSVGYTAYNEDGTVSRQSSSIFDNGSGTPIALDSNGLFRGFLLESSGSCASYSLLWNEARAMWLIWVPPVCG